MLQSPCPQCQTMLEQFGEMRFGDGVMPLFVCENCPAPSSGDSPPLPFMFGLNPEGQPVLPTIDLDRDDADGDASGESGDAQYDPSRPSRN